MASDDELEPTQTQSQTNGEPNLWLNNDAEQEIWGRLRAKTKSMRDFGTGDSFDNIFRKEN